MTTDAQIRKLLKDNPPARKFVPYCYLSEEVDALTVYFEGDPDYSARLTDRLTIYRSLATEELVGFRVDGILDILRDLPIYVRGGNVELATLLLAFRGGCEPAVAEVLNELARGVRGMSLELP